VTETRTDVTVPQIVSDYTRSVNWREDDKGGQSFAVRGGQLDYVHRAREGFGTKLLLAIQWPARDSLVYGGAGNLGVSNSISLREKEQRCKSAVVDRLVPFAQRKIFRNV